MDLATARQYLAGVPITAGLLPDRTEVLIRDEAVLGDACAFHYRPPRRDGVPAREVTVKLAAEAVQRFMGADPRERGRLEGRIASVVGVRLAEGGYQEVDPPEPPLVVTIYAHDLD